MIGEDDDESFYKLFEKYKSLNVTKEIPENYNTRIAGLGTKIENDKIKLSRIATSSKSRNSDRLYIYTKISENQETGE